MNCAKIHSRLRLDLMGRNLLRSHSMKKTKKNQGDSMSAGLNALHNDHQIITEQPGNDLCPVTSFKKYISLLHPDITAFFQYPNKSKKSFTRECVGKNSLGTMMKTIAKQANLSKTYTNHSIRKMTATAMYRSGFSLKEISHVTKHNNLDSLKHYISGPTYTGKENNQLRQAANLFQNASFANCNFPFNIPQ